MDVYTVNDTSPSELINHIQNNRPCVIRGFFSPDTVNMYVNHIANSQLNAYKIGVVPAYKLI